VWCSPGAHSGRGAQATLAESLEKLHNVTGEFSLFTEALRATGESARPAARRRSRGGG
jgi:hypothetical protein